MNIDPYNPSRDLCAVDGCTNLQYIRYADGNWADLCYSHYMEPRTRRARKIVLAMRKLVRLDAKKKIASAKAKRKSDYLVLPRICSECGDTCPPSDFRGDGVICEKCKGERSLSNRRKRLFGIDTAEYKALSLSQNGVCAICGLPSDDKSLAIDHCHATGDVRGLLCTSCNIGLGNFQDDLDLLASASSYLINSRLKKRTG